MIALLLLQCFLAVEGSSLCIKNGESIYEVSTGCCESEHVVTARLLNSECEQCDDCEGSNFQELISSNLRSSVQNKVAEGFDTLPTVSSKRFSDVLDESRPFLQTQNPDLKTISTSLTEKIILII